MSTFVLVTSNKLACLKDNEMLAKMVRKVLEVVFVRHFQTLLATISEKATKSITQNHLG